MSEEKRKFAVIEEVEIDEQGEVVTQQVLNTTTQIGDTTLEIKITPMNVHIKDSYKITNTKVKKEVLKRIREIAKEHGIEYKRSKGSWLREWKAHNTLYLGNVEKERTGSVDLNEDETLFRRFCYWFLALLEHVVFSDEVK